MPFREQVLVVHGIYLAHQIHSRDQTRRIQRHQDQELGIKLSISFKIEDTFWTNLHQTDSCRAHALSLGTMDFEVMRTRMERPKRRIEVGKITFDNKPALLSTSISSSLYSVFSYLGRTVLEAGTSSYTPWDGTFWNNLNISHFTDSMSFVRKTFAFRNTLRRTWDI